MSSKKPKISNKPQHQIPITDITKKDKKFHISFEYLDSDNKKYSMDLVSNSREKIQFYNDLLKKINEYSKLDNFKLDIRGRYSDTNHIHPINWRDDRIREKSFTCLNSSLMEQIKDDCWQLGINNQGFRIHGFFIENIFYIVWLDPKHNLYNMK